VPSVLLCQSLPQQDNAQITFDCPLEPTFNYAGQSCDKAVQRKLGSWFRSLYPHLVPMEDVILAQRYISSVLIIRVFGSPDNFELSILLGVVGVRVLKPMKSCVFRL